MMERKDVIDIAWDFVEEFNEYIAEMTTGAGLAGPPAKELAEIFAKALIKGCDLAQPPANGKRS